MAKVLLVEDDNNLREIYQARLMAEGYDIATAQNGEEALVVAKQQKPDLIISDVMMPRISGFEMLDILRNTAELKHTKVIMLTALGQEDDQTRANSLGADKYLVKSQVTLEDIVTATKELLSGDAPATATPASATAAAPAPAADSSSMVAPAAPSVPAISHLPSPADPATTSAPADTAVPAADAGQPAAAAPAQPPAANVPVAPVSADVPVVAAPAPATAAAPVDPSGPAATTPEPTTVPPVAASVAVEPEPAQQVPTGPTIPAQPPEPAVIDKAAQGLEAEEAALRAQIASYSQPSATDIAATPDPQPAADTPVPPSPSEVTQANNDQALADAVKQLNAPEASPEPATAPDLSTAAVTPAPDPAAVSASAAPADVAAANDPNGRKIIQPISDPAGKPDLNALLAKEEAANPTVAPAAGNGTPASPAPAVAPATPQSTPGQPFNPNTSL